MEDSKRERKRGTKGVTKRKRGCNGQKGEREREMDKGVKESKM